MIKKIVEILLYFLALVCFIYAFLAAKSLEYWLHNSYATEIANRDIKYYLALGLVFCVIGFIFRAITRKSD